MSSFRGVRLSDFARFISIL